LSVFLALALCFASHEVHSGSTSILGIVVLGEGAERVLRDELVSNPNIHGNVELGRGHKGVANEAEGCDKEVTAAAKA